MRANAIREEDLKAKSFLVVCRDIILSSRNTSSRIFSLHPGSTTTAASSAGDDKKANRTIKEASVSVCRTYLVANEWNELHVTRKTHLGLQIVIVIFLL